MKETLKSKKGITLITLVITIIILIILAGISISMLVGEDGVITKAKQGRQNMQNAAIEEQERLNVLYGEMDSQLVTGSTTNSGTPINPGITGGNTGENASISGGGLTQEEHDALMSLVSYTPNMYDINPTQSTVMLYTADNTATPGLFIYAYTGGAKRYTSFPVCGYTKIAFNNNTNIPGGIKFCYIYVDGTQSEYYSITYNSWTEYYDIPSNCLTVKIHNSTSITNNYWDSLCYSLLTADSPYNPDNQ